MKPGHRLRVTGTGERVVIWSGAPGPGRYWAHRDDGLTVLVKVVWKRAEAEPRVTIVPPEEWPSP